MPEPLFGDDAEFSKKHKIDDGLDRRYRKVEKDPDAPFKKKVSKSVKYSLRPERMFFKDEERKMHAEYFNRFKHDVEERYGDFTTAQELLVDGLCYAIVRLERKSRLESWFGRFFDRVAPHDPLGQITATLKALGLLTEKKDKEQTTAASEIKKILAQDSAVSEAPVVGYDEWLAQRANAAPTEFVTRTPEELPNYSESDYIFTEEGDEEQAS